MADEAPDERTIFTKLIQGFQVTKAAAAIAAISTKPLFTVIGGRVAIYAIVGEVTTIIQAQANATKLISTPTVGSAVDLCATAELNGKEAGTLLGITGLFSDAMLASNAGATVLPRNPVAVPEGVIGLNTAADNTGAAKWDIWYVPLDRGAYIDAA